MNPIRRRSSIYFLIRALPATFAGLFGVYTFLTFLRLPALDPEDPDYVDRSWLFLSEFFLLIFVVVGIANLIGYYAQVFRPHTVSRFFWSWSVIYNAILFIAYVALLRHLGRPPAIDLPLVIIIAVFLGTPLIGLVLSFLCVFAKDGR